jgi:hypothetical protein
MVKVHILPAEAECFTLPHAERQSNRVQRGQTVAADVGQELLSLRGVEWPDLPVDGPRLVGQGGDIAADEVPAQGMPERLLQDAAAVLHAPG